MTDWALFSLLLAGLIACSFGQQPCQEDTCPDTAGTFCYDGPEEAPIEAFCVPINNRPGTCSSKKVTDCAEFAECIDEADFKSFRCVCAGEATGDGYKGAFNTGCTLPFKACQTDNNCPQFAVCNDDKKCECITGFEGDGRNCTDKNECDDSPCDPNASCDNIPGSYICTCHFHLDYVGDGKTCKRVCQSSSQCDAPRAFCNIDGNCECKKGFEGDGSSCKDIDECKTNEASKCDPNARCENKEGSFDCVCNNGYAGDGYTCNPLPQRCADIPNVRRPQKYLLDPDFTGPANAFEVECSKVRGIIVTKVYPTGTLPLEAPENNSPLDIDYDPTPDDLKPLLENSGYCSQDFSFSCQPGFALFPGTKVYDAYGNFYENWGSTHDQQCACGELNVCPDKCYCDGTQTDAKTKDDGKIVDKSRLPITKIEFTQGQASKGRVQVEPLVCSDFPVAVPRDCHDAKLNYRLNKNQPYYIDVDGPRGPLLPFLVYCDVESFSHVGVTNVPPRDPDVTITDVDGEPVDYNIETPTAEALIQGSAFCSQRIEFQCTNSQISNGGKVAVSNTGRVLSYFPGGEAGSNGCGCGSTQSCAVKTEKCNCDIQDGVPRKDFGLIVNRADLPVTKLTAEIGGQKSATYVVGNLQCSQKQFGIEPNCEKYRATGVKEDYSYLIDPDGPGNLDPFLVECRFIENPAQGQTVINHLPLPPSDVAEIMYLLASKDQINALKTRSTMCIQDVSIGCKEYRTTVEAGSLVYIPQSSQEALSLSNWLSTCDGSQGCRCDQGSSELLSDSGTIANKTFLPIGTIDSSAISFQGSNPGSVLNIEVKPLICSEIFPTCAALKQFVDSGSAVEGEASVVNGRFTIDPDGPGGVEPFEVDCQFPATTVVVEPKIESLKPNGTGLITECFEISYKNQNGDEISPEQINALVKASGKCSQSLSLNCQNAPASGMVEYSTCDGVKQPGWGGSFGADTCACAVNGNCDGGPDDKCNCDLADNNLRVDEGNIIDTDRLPVCKVCLSITDPPRPSPYIIPFSRLQFKVRDLKCDGGKNGNPTCQQARYTNTWALLERPVIINSGDVEYPVGCRYYPDPPMGVLVVKPKDPVIPTDEEVDVTVKYFTYNITLLTETVSIQRYCSQKIYFYCYDDADSFVLGGDYGLYNLAGNVSYNWQELDDEGDDVKGSCEKNADLCAQCNNKVKGFLIPDKEFLPIYRIKVPATGVTVVVDETECFDIQKSCQEILDNQRYGSGWGGGSSYAVDPDLAGPIRPLSVDCFFDKKNGNGVTQINVEGKWVASVNVQDQPDDPATFELPVKYEGATPEQINELAKISDFCWQGVKYECKESPLLGDSRTSYYNLYNNFSSPSFGTGPDVNFPGCACEQLGTCKPGYTCNCDALGPMAVDQGVITNKDKLPLTSILVGGQQPGGEVNIQVTNIRCSRQTIEIPKDCEEALKKESENGIDYTRTSEYLISPKPGVIEPFMTRCDFTIKPGNGVTVVRPDKPPKDPVDTPPNEPEDVPYKGPTTEQIQALIEVSGYCYQGVRYDCQSTAFTGVAKWFSAGNPTALNFWGGGDAEDNNCACGADKACGGLDSAAGQITRKCNCDANDGTPRSDAGFITDKTFLPISSLVLSVDNANVNLTIGDLYCSQEPLEFNECDLGFHDCHEKADCVNEKDGYRCDCREGWQGKGVVLNARQARANGRECFDDDECVALNPCPYSANCTNQPGGFLCTCKEGYLKTSPTTCVDIDECAEPSLNDCGANSICENLDGSYRCLCERGYRGDGRTCIPVGQCQCFGDPHCISYDKKWLTYQGLCQYVMSQDGCGQGETPSFKVIIDTWKRNDVRPGYFSYVKSVQVLTANKNVTLGQGKVIHVNGIIKSRFYDSPYLSVIDANQKVRLRTNDGLEVTWDGDDFVEVVIPKNAQGQTCGLCGNFDNNPDNDWTIGPACPGEQGAITTNPIKFGESWSDPDAKCDVQCDAPEPPEDPCVHDKNLVSSDCDKLLDINSSPFKDCLKAKAPEMLEAWRRSCVYDTCQGSDPYNEKICAFAENIAKDCRENENVAVSGWRLQVEYCEVPTCSNNMVYKTCGSSEQPTCLETSVQMLENELCQEGCFCEDGLMLDGDKCVKPEQCGCYYKGGYIPVGAQLVADDCSEVVICHGKDNLEEKEVDCGPGKECSLDEGMVGCFCVEGTMLDPASKECVVDKCHNKTCGSNMECIEGTCTCKMGFLGDCNTCEDIDECATNSTFCNGIGQVCVNTEGSYYCDCKSGFIPFGTRCKDVDECDRDLDNCGDNSECVNTLGEYRCECCVGFKPDGQGNCVPDGPPGAKCCACKGEKCTRPGKVCGTDGNTYNSYRSLSVSSCKNDNPDLKVSYSGNCQSTCNSVACDKQYASCEPDEKGVPQCGCPTCSNSSVTYEDKTVCASNKITYESICHMKKVTCEAEIETEVTVVVEGQPCPGKGDPPVVGPWGEFGECSEPCKQGVRVRTRNVVVEEGSTAQINDKEELPCYNTCDAGPCKNDTCTGPGEVCIVDAADNPSCVCRDCADYKDDPVCGRIGYVIQTFDTECELEKQACLTKEPNYELLEPRACEDKPLVCGAIRKYINEEDDNGCKSEIVVNVGECYGGCDDEATHCCVPKGVEKRTVRMNCSGRPSYIHEYNHVASCECKDRNELQQP